MSTSASGDFVETTVDDSGPGIAAELREKIFERFYREAGDRVTGSGLGLAIVRQIVMRHEGQAEAGPSLTLGGLRVRIRLPVKGPDARRALVSDARSSLPLPKARS